MRKYLFIFGLFFLASAPVSLYSQEKKEKVVVVEEEVNVPEIKLVNNTVEVKNAPKKSRLEIISILGSKVKEIEMKTSDGTYDLDLPKGIYIFKLEGLVRKFVIK